MQNAGMAVSMVYPILKSITRYGQDTQLFCEQVGFDLDLLHDAEARISGERYEQLMYQAADFLDDDHFGLHQGQLTDMADLGILGYVMMHSGTIGESLIAYRRYNDILCSGFNLNWQIEGDEVRLRFYSENPIKPMSRHCTEDMVSSIYQMIGHLSNRRIQVRALTFQHSAPDHRSLYESIFGVTPLFEQETNEMLLSKTVLEAPILYANARLREMFERLAEETMGQLTEGQPFSRDVYHWMLKGMPSGLPTLEQTASEFHMSMRTLQSKLKQEQTSFTELLTRVRKELAISYLHLHQFSITEVAYALHFSEPSAFQNAFKRWTGVTPRTFRMAEKKGM
ncbi:AraC family transcriptional regulator [Marinicrinis sediminis]|uniref:AraC family transcriptional regulator n=1 Tax=Marinicrinis sediminis TaxID=1652465 RepID=A0ABW5R9T3_9BACL